MGGVRRLRHRINRVSQKGLLTDLLSFKAREGDVIWSDEDLCMVIFTVAKFLSLV